MLSRSKLPALLLIVVFPMLACQMLVPAQTSCRVYVPAAGRESHRNGERVTFKVDEMVWKATVDCAAGYLVDGQPVRPANAKETRIPVKDSTYKLITTDPNVSMAELHQNGSQVRIDAGDAYYLISLTAAPAAQGDAAVSYFMGGQALDGLIHLYCYDRTPGEVHRSLPGIASMWTVEKPVTVSLICSGRGFVLEVSTNISMTMLTQGPTPIPATPAPALMPEAPGSDL